MAVVSSRRALPVLVASVLVMVACGSSDSADTEPADDSAEVAEVAFDPTAADAEAIVEPEPEPEPELASDLEPEPTPESEPEATLESEPEATLESEPSADCLVGDWVITQDEMNAYFDALLVSLSEAAGVDLEITGQTLLTLTESEYTYVADFDLELDAAGITGVGTSSGTASGTWAVENGLVVTTLGSSDLEVLIDVGGVTINGSDFANGLLDSVPINDAPFDCDGPTIGFQADETGDTHHDVTLVPA